MIDDFRKKGLNSQSKKKDKTDLEGDFGMIFYTLYFLLQYHDPKLDLLTGLKTAISVLIQETLQSLPLPAIIVGFLLLQQFLTILHQHQQWRGKAA